MISSLHWDPAPRDEASWPSRHNTEAGTPLCGVAAEARTHAAEGEDEDAGS